MKQKLITTLILLALGTNAHAGKAVFDRSNFAKNTVTAAQQVRQTAQQAAILANEVKQYQAMLTNLKTLSPAVLSSGLSRGLIPAGQYQNVDQVLNASEGVYHAYTSVNYNLSSLLKTYQKLAVTEQELMQVAEKTKLSPTRILEVEAQRAAAGKEIANSSLSQLDSLNAEIKNHQRRNDALMKEIPATSGALEALQIVGSQNALMSDQISHLVMTSSNAAQAVQGEALMRARERERAAEIAREQEARNNKIYPGRAQK